MKTLLGATVLLLGAASLQAENEAGFQLSLVPEMALQRPDVTIHGLALNLVCGQNPQHSFTLGLVNLATRESSGFSLGLVNVAESYDGVQWGAVNVARNFNGWQFGAANVATETATGWQFGVFNSATTFKGLQLGVINFTDTLDKGLQIGVVNLANSNPWFTEFPHKVAPLFTVFNWSF